MASSARRWNWVATVPRWCSPMPMCCMPRVPWPPDVFATPAKSASRPAVSSCMNGYLISLLPRSFPAPKATQVGDGLDATATMGPLASEPRVQAMQAIVADALAHGATLACGGRRIERPGCFFEPTVVLNPAPDCRLMQEEPFGPIAPIVPFSDLDEVLAHANALPYGLSAYVFSQNIGTAMAAARGLEAGMVAINSLSLALTETPFGGVKASGLGHEGGTEGVQAYTVKKFISLA